VGHKVKTLSYGLYAGAPALATKVEVMKLLRYIQPHDVVDTPRS